MPFANPCSVCTKSKFHFRKDGRPQQQQVCHQQERAKTKACVLVDFIAGTQNVRQALRVVPFANLCCVSTFRECHFHKNRRQQQQPARHQQQQQVGHQDQRAQAMADVC